MISNENPTIKTKSSGQYPDRQALTTAIEKFSEKYDFKQLDPKLRVYRDLIPKSTPGPGQQFAFEVDLDKCTGCKACVTACHNENGLDEDETWRSVGLIQGGTSARSAVQHVTSACHHCAEPACMHGCPTLAYTKDPQTGIVIHLEDQCFGCQYCILKCPYDAPKYNKKKGVVHKCDMCIGRLKAGQPPACVRACPTDAIRITIVDKNEVMEKPSEFVKIPDAPASDYTYPTTRYKRKRGFPVNTKPVDYHHTKPENSHFPLVIMLVLTQLSVGAFLASFMLQQAISAYLTQILNPFQILSALFLGLFALGASLSHLGRPQYFYRALLGLRTSWLSREILAFFLFSHLAMFYAGCSLIPVLGEYVVSKFGPEFYAVLRVAILLFGIAGIYCSAKVYKDTRRPFWDNFNTNLKFFLTMGILGFATIFLVSMIHVAIIPELTMAAIMATFGKTFSKIILGASVIKLFLEATVFITLRHGDLSFIKRSAMLMIHQLNNITRLRFCFGILGGVALPILIINLNYHQSPAWVLASVGAAFLSLLIGELMERYLFFRAVVPLKMPGG